MIDRIDDIVEDYCSMTSGCIPNKEILGKLVKVIGYLIDNDFSNKEILERIIKLDNISSSEISYEGINTLLEQNKFYYHNSLHIKSKAPSFDPITLEESCEPFYLEMKIKFSLEDLLNYYYDKTLVPIGLRDKDKDLGSLKHLLNKYSKIDGVESIDIILSMIDRASEDIEKQIYGVFELESYIREVFEYYNELIPMARYSKTNQIVWR